MPSTEPIPELADIETAKENIAPLPKGRSVSHLSKLITSTPDSRHNYLQASHQAFQEELETSADLDDPLDVNYRYINWMVENYPEGDGGQVSFLEKTVRLFRDDDRYKEDIRYLKCWLMYASKVKGEAQGDVLEYVFRNGFGEKWALFYETYAEYLEASKQ